MRMKWLKRIALETAQEHLGSRKTLRFWKRGNAASLIPRPNTFFCDFFLRISSDFIAISFPVESKVRLQGHGYNLFCSHSSCCLEAVLWQYFEEAVCAPKVRLKWYGFEGFSPDHSSHCCGGLFPQYHYTQKDYRTELYYYRIIFGNSCSMSTEPNCFWN